VKLNLHLFRAHPPLAAIWLLRANLSPGANNAAGVVNNIVHGNRRFCHRMFPLKNQTENENFIPLKIQVKI
jgi:hypothetical protein